jgi:PAS domain S-box-containing protein
MDLRLIVAISVVLQLTAAILALRLVRITGTRSAWLLIAAATSLMAFRRGFTLFQITAGKSQMQFDLTSEMVALATSALMAVGIARIASLFLSVQKSKEEIQESRRVLKAILDASPVGICLVRERTIEWTNLALQDMLGHPRGVLNGRSTSLLYPDIHEYVRVGRELYSQLKKKGMGALDTCLRRREGTVFPCYFLARPLDANDPRRGHIIVMTDLSERRKLEEQIIHSQKMEAIGRLAGGIAHDFNNLLTSIMGYAEMLQINLEEGTRLRRYTAEISKAAELAASLTRQLLTFSHKQVQQPRVLHVDTVVSDIHQMLKRLIGEDIELVIHLTSKNGWVRMDQGQVEQVLMNLVVNARDAMIQGGRLTIETATVNLDDTFAHTWLTIDAGPYVVLTVQDTGCGMDMETRAHIFEPFFTTKAMGKGTGLGLATTYAIVHQAGGAIRVQSGLGTGSAFTVYLPLVEATPDDPQISLEVDRGLHPQGSETVLLVEDEASVRELARETLKENGYTVLEAGDGHEALRICRNHADAIHLMVTDVVMPQMSGCQLAKHLKMLRPETEVLYISGYVDETITHHGILEPGAFLQKPFAPAELLRRVRQILDSALAHDRAECGTDDRSTLQTTC